MTDSDRRAPMFCYFACGLGICSELPLPELMPAECQPDVRVQLELPDGDSGHRVVEQPHLAITSQEATLALPDVGKFVIQGGNAIRVSPAPGVALHTLRRHLLGNVLAILLFQRGYLALHASVVNLDGWAVAFVGDSGIGKSSIAATLHTQGCALMADDVAAVQFDTNSARAWPAFPRLKLSHEVARILQFGATPTSEFEEPEDKRLYLAADGFESQPLHLSRVYVLQRADQCEIKALTPDRSVMDFIRQSVPVRFGLPGGAAHFMLCVQLARLIPAYQLLSSHRVSELPRLAQIVAEHGWAKKLERNAV